MIPSILTSQIRRGVEDFLQTTFPPSNRFFHGMLDRLIAKEGGLFRGPYLSVKLPFRQGAVGPNYFPELPFEFPPYLHQEQAFDRLSGGQAKSTVISTGTGSGKTECFLYPILDYCRQHQGERGIKAILIYPMNALATDQAKRIAKTIWKNDKLKDHVTAGLFIGGDEEAPTMAMTAEQVITNRETMRLMPPDILLTNYKMLDYLMIRPKDFPIWKQNEPETLRFLVVDELHTFDGAQGTDLACLIRRLKERLRTPKERLVCVGTSATLGAQEDAGELCQYAAKVFGEDFDDQSVITESLVTPAEFFGETSAVHSGAPSPDNADALNPDTFGDDRAYIAAQVGLWFGHKVADYDAPQWKLTLANDLIEHDFLRHLLRILRKPVTAQSEVLNELGKVLPGFATASAGYQQNVLNSFLALISCARRKKESKLLPFLQVRSQLWFRELRRLVADVKPEPTLAFSDDLKEEEFKRHLAVIHCRECGAIGWGSYKRKQDANLVPDLQDFYARFFSDDPTVHFIFPLEDRILWEGEQQEFTSLICGHCLHLSDGDQAPACPACGSSDRLIPVLVSNPRIKKGDATYGSHDCPYCRSSNSLTILGSRAASMTSVVISQLYSSKFNDDKKLLTFSDSVQDASHRASFFAARTFRFNFRSALQQFIVAQTAPLELSEASDQFIKFWRSKWDEPKFITSFLPPDLAWFEDYEFLKENGELPEESKLSEDLGRRISWEITSEYGFNSRIGRTLEKTGCSIAFVKRERLKQAVAKSLEILRNEIGGLNGLEEAKLLQLLTGMLVQLKGKGGIEHPALAGYVKNLGNVFALRWVHFMPKFGTSSRAPAFLTKKRGTRFDPLLALGTTKTWYQQWLEKNLGLLNPAIAQFAEPLFDKLLLALVEAGVLVRHDIEGQPVWAINPNAMHISASPRQHRCIKCGHNTSGATEESDSWVGMPCLRFNCGGSYAEEPAREDYYGKLYSTGDVERLFAEEHTGLLDRKKRDDIERRFKRAAKDRQPGDPNLLSCTPTLEMGIDIGDLSSLILCSVPPAQANYLQRVGRAGRKDGNSLAVTLANGQPHDLYFYARPEEMLAGRVEPPGCFLDAPAVLERQFTAFCFDRWVESGVHPSQLPLKLGAVLANLEKPNRKEIFPYNFLLFIENQRTAFLEQFVKMFHPGLKPESLQYLHDYASGDAGKEGSLEYKITDKLHFVLKEQKSLKKRVKQLAKTIKEKKDDPIKDQNFDKEIEDLEMEKASLNAIIAKISEKDTFNFFTDEGLLPNYSFPEAGVTLRSIILKKKANADQHGKYKSTIFEYERPAATAISELAPANRFYAEGRMVTVDQIDMALSTIEEWQFCNECSHHELVLTGGDTQCCPRCHSPLWKDEAQRRQMVRMRQVVATTYDRDSRIEDDSDVREPEFYNKQLLVDFDPKFITSAYQLDKADFPFGFEFLRKVAFREINFGQKQANVEEINIAGKPMPKIGFVLCRECGKVHNVREKFEHAISCRYRNSKYDKTIEDCLYLYREFSSEAIRILLPVLSLTEDQKLHSFVAALYLGLKKKFGGNIDHLRTAIHEEPIPDSGLRKKYLVLYDVVPGGTGYLKELMRPPQPLMEVFQLAREVLRSCECGQSPDKDGCYRCLYIYRQSHDRANVSRKVALDFLGKLLDGEPTFTKTDTISNISINSLLESELEARFIEALRRSKHQEQAFQLKPDVVNGKPGWRLNAGEQTWMVEPQVEIGAKDNVAIPLRADFVFHPERRGHALPIAIFTDGFMFHAEGENHRVGCDMAQRMALRRSGRFSIWSLTWDDVEDRFKSSPDSAFENLLNHSPAKLGQLLAAQGLNSMLGLHESRNFELFVRFLTQPDHEAWGKYAALSAIALPFVAMISESAADSLRNAVLNNGSVTLPMGGGSFFAGIFERKLVDDSPIFVLCTTASKEAAMKGDPEGIECIARFYDEQVTAAKTGFKAAWIGFLRAYNIFQFLPHSFFVTSRGLEANAYATLTDAIPFKGVLHPTVDASELVELLDLTAPEACSLLRLISSEGLPLPEPGFELPGVAGEVVATAELAWPGLKLAILLESEASSESAFLRAHWTTQLITAAQGNPHEFLARLRVASQQGGANAN
jgi:DEAD/DEAH box helicase domain-containing protein